MLKVVRSKSTLTQNFFSFIKGQIKISKKKVSALLLLKYYGVVIKRSVRNTILNGYILYQDSCVVFGECETYSTAPVGNAIHELCLKTCALKK